MTNPGRRAGETATALFHRKAFPIDSQIFGIHKTWIAGRIRFGQDWQEYADDLPSRNPGEQVIVFSST
jgi:hypothetical protein